MDTVAAFAPGNVSCVFRVIADPDPEKMHSLGLSFTIADGVTARVSKAKTTTVTLNGRPISIQPVDTLIAKLGAPAVTVTLTTPLPLSFGFGVSGASCLATALAINELLDLGLSRTGAALAAHSAEVTHLTGLGDVCSQAIGGCVLRSLPGQPLAGTRLPILEQPLFYRLFGPLDSATVLGDAASRAAINAAADAALERITSLCAASATDLFPNLVRASCDFAVSSGLAAASGVSPHLHALTEAGTTASMIMLGRAIFALEPFPECRPAHLSHRAACIVS